MGIRSPRLPVHHGQRARLEHHDADPPRCTHPWDQEIVYPRRRLGPLHLCRLLRARLPMLRALPGDRVGVLDWNSRRHFELYWSIPAWARSCCNEPAPGPRDLGYVVGQATCHVRGRIIAAYCRIRRSELAPDQGWIVMTESRWTRSRPRWRRCCTTKTCWPPPTPRSTGPRSTKPRLTAPLHHRHHGQAQGRVLLAPRHLPAFHGHGPNMGMTLDDCVMLITPMFHGQCWGLPQAPRCWATRSCCRAATPPRTPSHWSTP